MVINWKFFPFAAIYIFLFSLVSFSQEEDGVLVESEKVSTVDIFNTCRRVKNSHSKFRLYIPKANVSEWNSFLESPGDAEVSECLPCGLPWGGSIVNGSSVRAYQSSSVAYGSSCRSQTRRCSDGTLSGKYRYRSCKVNPRPPSSSGGSGSSAPKNCCPKGYVMTGYKNGWCACKKK